MVIQIRIDNNALSVAQPTAIVGGSKNYYRLEAVFTPDWEGLTRYVVFPSSKCSIVMDGDAAQLPEALTAENGALRFGIIGMDSEENIRIATNYVRLKVLEGAKKNDSPPPVPSAEDAWDKYVNNVVTKIQAEQLGEVKEDLFQTKTKLSAFGNDLSGLKEQHKDLKSDLSEVLTKEYYSNIVNPEEIETGYYIGSAGYPVPGIDYSTTGFLDIHNLERVTWYMNTKHPEWKNSCYVCCFTADKEFIERVTYTTNAIAQTLSIPDNCKYIKLSFLTEENTEIYVGDKDAIDFVYEPFGLKTKIIQPSNETVEARGNCTNLGERLNKFESEIASMGKNLPRTVIYYGDSLTQGGQDGTKVTRRSVLQGLLGPEWLVRNGGVGGEASNTIAVRGGGLWLILKEGITIPSDTSAIEVQSYITDQFGNALNFGSGLYSSAYGFSWSTVNNCIIDGIECQLKRVQGTSKVTLQRVTNGTEKTITRPTRIHVNSETFEKNPVLIICIGQNGGFNNSVSELIGQIRGIIKNHESERYIVVGIPHSTTAGYTWEAEFNVGLQREFGKHYLDIEKYLKTPIKNGDTIVSSFGMDDNNLVPTSDDLTKISNNQYPTSIMYDGIHFNQYGYTAWAKQEYLLGKDLRYWN